mgnify:FL=1
MFLFNLDHFGENLFLKSRGERYLPIVADLMANCCTNVNVNRGLTSFIKLGGQLPPPPFIEAPGKDI